MTSLLTLSQVLRGRAGVYMVSKRITDVMWLAGFVAIFTKAEIGRIDCPKAILTQRPLRASRHLESGLLEVTVQ